MDAGNNFNRKGVKPMTPIEHTPGPCDYEGCKRPMEEFPDQDIPFCAYHQRLIAKAPEMLDLVQRVVATMSASGKHNSEERQRELVAIARILLREIT
jgi:hypothetical protein